MQILEYWPVMFAAVSGVGLALLAVGVRGRPAFGEPRCGRCGYDLRGMSFVSGDGGRVCPECGAGLEGPGAVRYGGWRRQPRAIALGLAIMVLPWGVGVPLISAARGRVKVASGLRPIGTAVLLYTRVSSGPPVQVVALPSPAPASAPATRPTQAVLASLPQTVDQPWDWQELERRQRAGSLSVQEKRAAVDVLIAHRRGHHGTAPEEADWSRTFVDGAAAHGDLTPQQVGTLCQMYWEGDVRVQMRGRARAGEPMWVTVRSDVRWRPPGVEPCWALAGVVAEGATPLVPQDRTYRKRPMWPDELSAVAGKELRAALGGALAPGEHELAFTFDVGAVGMPATLRGMDGKPGTPEKWPPTLGRWQVVVKRRVTVVGAREPLVVATTRPADAPHGTIGVESAVVRATSRGTPEVLIDWTVDGAPPTPPVCYHVTMRMAGGRELRCGVVMLGRTADGRSFDLHTSHGYLREPLPAEVKVADFELVPAADFAEKFDGIDEIWGGTMDIKGVRLGRLDAAGQGRGE